MLDSCRELGHDYVVRAQYDRKASEQTRLWEHMGKQATAHTCALQVPARKKSKKRVERHRSATPSVRYAKVTFPPPAKDARHAHKAPVEPWAVQVADAPPGWLTIRRGWLQIELMAQGIALALTPGKRGV
jgi:hypothetical protein